MKKIWLPLTFIALLALLAAGLRLNPREVPSPLIGKPAPHFELPRLDAPDKTFTQKEMLGKVWVLNVWASWCPPCLVEHPVVTQLSKTVPVVGLNYKDTREDALPWLKRNGDPFKYALFDANGRIAMTPMPSSSASGRISRSAPRSSGLYGTCTHWIRPLRITSVSSSNEPSR